MHTNPIFKLNCDISYFTKGFLVIMWGLWELLSINISPRIWGSLALTTDQVAILATFNEAVVTGVDSFTWATGHIQDMDHFLYGSTNRCSSLMLSHWNNAVSTCHSWGPGADTLLEAPLMMKVVELPKPRQMVILTHGCWWAGIIVLEGVILHAFQLSSVLCFYKNVGVFKIHLIEP